MNYKRKKVYREPSRRAFTLIESLTVVFLSVIIVTSAYGIYLMSMKTFTKNSASAELTQNARISLERMSRDIRQSSEFVTVLPTDPGSGTPPSEIKFQDGHIIGLEESEEEIQYITYYLNGTDLHKKTSHYFFATDPNIWVSWSTFDESENPPTESTDEDVVKAENISSLQFWGTNLVTINISVADSSTAYTFETKILGRNVQ